MESNSRLVGSSCDRCLVAVQSWDKFREGLSGCCMDMNLIVHHSITNIISQARHHVRILDIVDETCDFTPLC